MNLLPEWAPHIHPLLVHFPIALLFVAALIDVGALLRRSTSLRNMALGLYGLGFVAAFAAFRTGKAAADLADVPAAAQTVLTTHADWALYTVWFFGIYLALRLAEQRFFTSEKRRLWAPMALVGLGGLFLLFETAEHGAQMVFEHGVGVQAVTLAAAEAEEDCPVDAALDFGLAAVGGPVMQDAGWTWTPDKESLGALPFALRWPEGTVTDLVFSLVLDSERGTVLGLSPASGADQAFTFTAGEAIASVQAEVALNLDGFDGRVALLHHIQDAETYDFLAVEQGQMIQGRRVEGAEVVMDTKPFAPEGWFTLRVVGDKTHFRGYGDGALVTHGHDDALGPGTIGLRFQGQGTLRLAQIDAVSLR